MVYTKSHEEHAISPLTISTHHNAWPAKILKKLLGGREVGEKTFCVHQKNGLEFFMDCEPWDSGSDYLLEKIKTDKKLVKIVSLNSRKIANQIIATIRNSRYRYFSTLNNKQIIKFLTSTYKMGNDLCAYGYIPVLSDHYFQKFTSLLKNIVREKSKLSDVKMVDPEIVFLLSSHNEFVPSKLARVKLLNIVKKWNKLTNDIPKSKQIKKHFDDWYWVDFGQLGPGQKFSEVVDSVQKLAKNKAAVIKELKEIESSHKILNSQQKKIIKQLKLNAQEKYLFAVASEFMYLKGLRMEVLFGMCAAWSRALDEVSLRLKIDKKLLYYASVTEICDALSNKNKLDKSILAERTKFCVWVANTEHTQDVYAGQEAKEFLKTVKFKEDKKAEKVLVIHGTVASMGYAKGRVKIVNKLSEIGKVEEGDVLVSVATHPGLLPAMRKAVAFITDAGGITSHAAIVAREMKKPCIIGAKIATKILKDGDMVELDTKRGNIKII